jgi:hypothetical protein
MRVILCAMSEIHFVENWITKRSNPVPEGPLIVARHFSGG